jgi:hypothetical protein
LANWSASSTLRPAASNGAGLHNPKWLKLVAGKPGDVVKWLRKHRDSAARDNE